jgi:hypothetical protein
VTPTDQEVWARVDAAIAAEAGPAPAAAPVSSLAPAALETKGKLEADMANPEGDYWRYPRNQAQYRDLCRAELAGQAEAVGPEHGIDDDHPVKPTDYSISDASGARSMSAEDADLVATFMPVAHGAGIGQQKVSDAVGWVLTGAASTVNEFRSLAVAAGWSDRAIETCMSWYAKQAADRGITIT